MQKSADVPVVGTRECKRCVDAVGVCDDAELVDQLSKRCDGAVTREVKLLGG